ncbi:MAG: hypothetical protein M1819_000924 [Sarea resinae]|nr:MAG: hypothetical protein M1819_000924 [Sarea resinae]
MADHGRDVYCTLVLSDSYLPGATVLAHSLRDNGTTKKLAVLVTPDSLQPSTLDQLKKLYDQVIPVERITNKTPTNLYLMGRPDLNATFTKVALWRQDQFRRIVYLDADVVALRAPDELFDLDVPFAAAPDVGWPDCFNSGVLVLQPNLGDYYALLALAQRGISFDGADQGLLNMHFRNYHRLSFNYNCTPSGHYQYVPAYRHFQSSISMVHYIGSEKPWLMGREIKSNTGVYEELLGRWWAVYDRHYRATQTGQTQEASRAVQQHVKGELENPVHGLSSAPSYDDPKSEPSDTKEKPPSKKVSEEKLNPVIPAAAAPAPAPAPKAPFSAPMSSWDPARAPPPAESEPEAANFPSQTYNMSSDQELFRPPSSYPQPPKDMWYEVPQQHEAPKPIFPWEAHAPPPTRVFAEEREPSPEPFSEPEPSATEDESSVADYSDPTTPTAQLSSPEPWEAYTRTNAWDDMPGIERYVSGLQQSRKAKLQTLQNLLAANEAVLGSPGEGPEGSGKRPSIRLTDFPTEIERPSLPVTPAPIRRPSFWGEERDEEGQLPAAEGVPRQEDWDPVAKLEELSRRQSDVLPKILSPPLPTSPSGGPIPDRKLPSSSAPVPARVTSPPVRSPQERVGGVTISQLGVGVPLSGGASPHGIASPPPGQTTTPTPTATRSAVVEGGPNGRSGRTVGDERRPSGAVQLGFI